ncbi:MAG: T9SS type A sorting domain-containing protein [Saprospiraceae bacterium]|nr:T9SS type A sorting domain-containing protein [Saprospiraceae bacterium]
MKKILLSFVILFSTGLLYSYNKLTVSDPRNSWNLQTGTIEEASLSVKPRGLYLEYGLYLTFSARGTNWYNSSDSLEIVLNFDLPANSMIIDSWLWIGDEISKAMILDKWTASSIYENIVKRRKDPSILTKMSDLQYELRIFPMAGNEKRKVKLTYLVPVTWNNDKIYAPIPNEILRSSKYDPSSLFVFAWENMGFLNPYISGVTNYQLADYSDPEFGEYKKAVIPLSAYQTPMSINFESTHTNGIFVSKCTHKNENYYQLAVFPDKLIDIQQKRKIAFLIDYDFTKSVSTKSQILNELKNKMLVNLNPADSFNILVSNFEIAKYSSGWVQATPENINNAFTYIEGKLGDISNLGSLLVNGINFNRNNGDNGKIFLLANSGQFDDYLIANNLMKDLLNLMASKVSFHIADFQSKFTYYQNVNGKNYSGNEYLYLNLSKLTYGSFTSVREGLEELQVINQAFSNLLGNFNSLDMHTKVSNGYCFGRMNIDNSNSFVSIDKPVMQVGKFLGVGSFEIEFSGQFDNGFFTTELTVESDDIVESDSTLAKIWAGNYIFNLESKNISNSTANDIIFKSIDARVLSLYTAFLCLEDSTFYCHNCKDETDLVAVDESGITKDSLLIYPNPFVDDLNVQIISSSPENIKSIKIYSLTGKIIYTFDTSQLLNREINTLHWDGKTDYGEYINAGIYILVFETQDGVINKKLLKT